ncbi:hypothetical protein M3Y99_00966200 [Aphelenchoides fujianensis]|nr:hypothetical protein M3Y99_00966200 [Aphelenchoides fujianensis]
MSPPLRPSILPLLSLLLVLWTPGGEAVKCLDCVGRDCMGTFCHGDLCVLSHYAPRWGDIEWGKPQVVKGCLSGKMIRGDIQGHCEAADAEGEDIFTCFCDTDFCNGKAVNRLEVEQVECVCNGPHCKGQKTCLGELCSHVTNHKTKEVEQGCVNASVPLIERRTAGACMIPPITGAMHHSVAKEAQDLLKTESCVCAKPYCNAEKPTPTTREKEKCKAYMNAESRKGCTGEFCFRAEINSSLSHMTHYATGGCVSFLEDAELAEELNPTGCARFNSEKLQVLACTQTKDEQAVGRARANQQVRERSKARGRGKQRPKMELTTFDDDEEEEADERAEEAEERDRPEPSESEPEEAGGGGGGEYEGEEGDEPKSTTELHYIFERPTLPPEPDDSNTALISVFLLVILMIILSAELSYKFELHKKLIRANYDTVAGG